MKLLRILAVLVVLSGSAALVAAAERVTVTPLPVPSPTTLQRSDITLHTLNGCGALFANVLNMSGYFFNPGVAVQVADDLHMTGPGHLCGIDIGYYKATPGTTVATVVFYASDPEDNTVPTVVLAGPYTVSGLPTGANLTHVDLELGTGTPDLTQDVWLGVSFSTASTGLIMAGPPETGTSHDYFYMTPPGQYTWFGGAPPADFMLAVYGNAFSTPAEQATWGRIKQLYR